MGEAPVVVTEAAASADAPSAPGAPGAPGAVVVDAGVASGSPGAAPDAAPDAASSGTGPSTTGAPGSVAENDTASTVGRRASVTGTGAIGGSTAVLTAVAVIAPATATDQPAVPDAATGVAAVAKTDCGKSDTCASHDSGPITRRSRPIDRLMNARTTAGSKWVPAHLASSMRASAALRAAVYERTDVITSNTSATATIRPASEISVPRSPFG
ncbi:unannotated protein [freshwater metagenome]|uniref:Unannotated protein n=1 Tax=freshwater metagenome TaxID=449393 RepID=A0A6J6GMW7_9ZZZZ